MTNIDEALQEYYSCNSLDDVTAQTILRRGKQKYHQKFLIRIAAIFILCTALIFSVRTAQLSQFTDAVYAQIEKNHKKGESPIVVSGDYGEVSKELSDLAFVVVPSEKLDGYTLLGGLYCSVQGDKAAQLKLLSPKGDTATLFVTKPTGLLQKVGKSTNESKRVEVSLWQEKGLFYGLAETK